MSMLPDWPSLKLPSLGLLPSFLGGLTRWPQGGQALSGLNQGLLSSCAPPLKRVLFREEHSLPYE